MTRYGTDESVDPESTTPVDRTMDQPVDDPAEANSDWTDDVIVKSEVILATDELGTSKRCRLCGSSDHLWVPFFSLNGDIELSATHLETISRISDISISYETDFSSVVCSYCMVKLEEFTVLREVWQLKSKEVHNREVPATKPIVPLDCMKAAAMTDASTQTDHTADECKLEVIDSDASSKQTSVPANEQETPPTEGEPSATSATEQEEEPIQASEAEETASPYEQDTVIIDDADTVESSSDSEVIDVEQYYGNRSKRRRTKRPTKEQLIKETLRLVKRQFRRKRHLQIR